MSFTSTQQIKYGSLISYITILFSILAGLIYTPWMIATIGKEDYGLYTLVVSVIGFFLMDFGLSTTISRFVAKYNVKGDQKSIGNLLGVAYKLYLLFDLLLCISLIVFYFCSPYIYKELTPIELDRFRIAYVIASVFSVISFPCLALNGLMIANEKFIQLKLCDLFHKIGVVVLMVLALLFGGGLYSLVVVNALIGVAVILIKFWTISRTTEIDVNWSSKDRGILKNICEYSSWVSIISICQRSIFNIMPTIIGVFLGSVEIAVFGVAMILEAYVYNFTNAIGGLFLPRVTRLVSRGCEGELLTLMICVGRIQLIVISLVLIIFFTVGSDFITLWLGADFKSVYICTLILIIPSILQAPQEIANTMIMTTNRVKSQAYVFIVMALVNICLSFILIELYGIIGVAISICVSYFLRTTLMSMIYKRALKIDMYTFFRGCYSSIIPSVIVVFFIGAMIRIFWDSVGWGDLVLKAGVIATVYGVIIYLFSLNGYEKDIIRGKLIKF